MRKVALIALGLLTILALIFGIYLYSTSKSEKTTAPLDLSLKDQILDNSSWIYLTEEDFYGYLNGTYTPTVQTIINSLEEATPVILHTFNDKYGNEKSGNFIVASAFSASNHVYTYYYNPSDGTYQKVFSSLETLLEGANAALIYNETEVLQ